MTTAFEKEILQYLDGIETRIPFSKVWYPRETFDTSTVLGKCYALRERLLDEIRNHERSLESRIHMTKREELALEALIEWLNEELLLLEQKMQHLELATNTQ